jgi:hypothetical protein
VDSNQRLSVFQSIAKSLQGGIGHEILAGAIASRAASWFCPVTTGGVKRTGDEFDCLTVCVVLLLNNLWRCISIAHPILLLLLLLLLLLTYLLTYLLTAIGLSPGGSSPIPVQTKIKIHKTTITTKQPQNIKKNTKQQNNKDKYTNRTHRTHIRGVFLYLYDTVSQP